MKKLLLFALILFSFLDLRAQESEPLEITGMVVDNDGLPVIGANLAVYIGNYYSTGTSTDVDGRFELQIGKMDSIGISSIGFKKLALSRTDLFENPIIELEQQTYDLETIVVTEHTQKSRNSILCIYVTRTPVFIPRPQPFAIEEQKIEVKLFPNPATDRVNIILEKEQGLLYLLAGNGAVMKSVVITGKTTTIPIDDLPAGIYYIQFQDQASYEYIGSITKIRN